GAPRRKRLLPLLQRAPIRSSRTMGRPAGRRYFPQLPEPGALRLLHYRVPAPEVPPRADSPRRGPRYLLDEQRGLAQPLWRTRRPIGLGPRRSTPARSLGRGGPEWG